MHPPPHPKLISLQLSIPAYGFDIRTLDNPYLKWADEYPKIVVWAGNPGSYLVDILPTCVPCHSIPSGFI